MKTFVAAVMAFAVACGSSGGGHDRAPDAGDPPGSDAGAELDEMYRSGTRIKTRVLTTPDGAKVFQGNYDNMRAEDCFFRMTSDGIMRCLPAAVLAGTYFADAACSRPAVLALTCAPPKYIAVATTSVTCPAVDTGTKMYTAVVVQDLYQGASCDTVTLPFGYSAYAIPFSGEEIPPSSFQSASISIE